VDSILSALWFFLPAGIANMVPVFGSKLPFLKKWNAPMDFGRTYRGHRLFGANKSWRGLVIGAAAATAVIALQKYLFTRNLFILEHSWIDYRPASIWLLGPLFAVGALVADAVESFFKRQRGIAPGKSWFPFDQIDYIIGGIIFSLPIAILSFGTYIWVLAAWFGMHLVFSYIGYLIGVKEHRI